MRIELNVNFPDLIPLENKKKEDNGSFSRILEDFLKDVNSQQLSARKVERALSEGKVKNVEEAMFTIEEADLSLRLLTEIRNKALESYQEIMRMQV